MNETTAAVVESEVDAITYLADIRQMLLFLTLIVILAVSYYLFKQCNRFLDKFFEN